VDIHRVSKKDVYTRLIFHIIMCIHLFGIPCIFPTNDENVKLSNLIYICPITLLIWAYDQIIPL
jgi:hypothetical protein